MARTIKMEMSWATAAQIIAAALENGTDKGRDSARAELYRMAQILDAMRDEQKKEQEPDAQAETASDCVELVEVIAHRPTEEGNAYGMTFHDVSTAMAYARQMRRKGYKTDVSPAFYTEPTTEAALESAARFFEDQAIKEART